MAKSIEQIHAFNLWIAAVAHEFRRQFGYNILDYGGFELAAGGWAIARFDETYWGCLAGSLAWQNRRILQDAGLGVDVQVKNGKRLGLSDPILEEKEANDFIGYRQLARCNMTFSSKFSPKIQELAQEAAEKIKTLANIHDEQIKMIYLDFRTKVTTISE